MNTNMNQETIPDLIEQLAKIAQSENMSNESKDITKFGQYVAELQNQIASLEKQIEEMSQNIEDLQNESIKAEEKEMIAESRNKLSHLKTCEQKNYNILKSLLMEFKVKGSNAFKIALKACKFDSLVKESAKISQSAFETFKTSSERTALFSKQLNDIRCSTSNAVALLTGHNISYTPMHAQSYDTDKGLLNSIEKGFINLSQMIYLITLVQDI